MLKESILEKLDEWPIRPHTKVRIKHYTKQQRAWARIHHDRGGTSFWLLRVQKEWLMLRGEVAAEVVDNLTREELMDRSLLYMFQGFDGDRLLRKIKDFLDDRRHTGCN